MYLLADSACRTSNDPRTFSPVSTAVFSSVHVFNTFIFEGNSVVSGDGLSSAEYASYFSSTDFSSLLSEAGTTRSGCFGLGHRLRVRASVTHLYHDDIATLLRHEMERFSPISWLNSTLPATRVHENVSAYGAVRGQVALDARREVLDSCIAS